MRDGGGGVRIPGRKPIEEGAPPTAHARLRPETAARTSRHDTDRRGPGPRLGRHHHDRQTLTQGQNTPLPHPGSGSTHLELGEGFIRRGRMWRRRTGGLGRQAVGRSCLKFCAGRPDRRGHGHGPGDRPDGGAGRADAVPHHPGAIERACSSCSPSWPTARQSRAYRRDTAEKVANDGGRRPVRLRSGRTWTIGVGHYEWLDHRHPDR